MATHSTEGTADERRAEEEAHPGLKLVALVVHGRQVHYSRHDARLKKAEQESERHEGLEGSHEAHAHVDEAPAEHERG